MSGAIVEQVHSNPVAEFDQNCFAELYTPRRKYTQVFIKIILSAQLLLLPKDRGQLFRRHMSRSPQLSYIVRAKFERNSTSRNINASFSNFPLFQFQLALIFVSFRTMQWDVIDIRKNLGDFWGILGDFGDFWGNFGEFWGIFGEFLGGFWGILEILGGILGNFGEFRGISGNFG